MKARTARPDGVLPFDFWEKEAQQEQEKFCRKVKELKTYEAPKNENEKLFNLQKRYYEGDQKALGQMFILLQTVGAKLVNIEAHSRKKLRLTQERIDELALDSAALVIEQIQKNRLMVSNSFVAYLRLQVLKVMFGQTKGEKFEKYCRRNGIDLFLLDDDQKQSLKRRFENRRVNHEG